MQRLTALGLRTAGWRFEGPVPAEKKYVVLAFPHTSNWDGVMLLAMTRSIDLEMSWMIKSTWFRGPLGPLLRAVGAVAIDRSKAGNIVQQMIEEFARRERFVLVVPPEGTRGRAEHWRSGFYHIARGADVPVVPGFVDYRHRRWGLGPPIYLTGDVGADMDRVRDFYAARDIAGLHPDQTSPIRLKEEMAETVAEGRLE